MQAGQCGSQMGTPQSDSEFPTQAPVDRQGVLLVKAALETHGNRSHSRLGNFLLLGCVIANSNPIVALEATRVLVAVYDGQGKDVAMELIEGSVAVKVEGHAANFCLLLGELVQIITPDILSESSVLFVRCQVKLIL